MPAPRRRSASLIAVPILLAIVASAPNGAAAGGCGTGDAFLGNGGFESPGVAPGTYTPFDAALVPPWNTTDVANQIEIWGDGFLGVPAFEGINFAELNANSAGTLYQDVVTTPGATMTWTLQHRGRDGTDVMRVLIGDSLTADVFSDAGWNAISADISDSETAWGEATDTYVVPVGQTCTRFAFRAVSSGVGIPSYGNFLDAVGFEVTIPAEPTPSPTAPPPAPTATPTGTETPVATSRPRITNPPTDLLRDRPAGPGPGTASDALLVGWLMGIGAFAALAIRRTRRGR